MDVVAINPATCLGELLQPGLNASCAVLQQLLQGSTDTQEYHWLGAVHVKDVAAAQILLFESPRASGRYLCTNGIYQFGDFADRVSKLSPEFSVHRFASLFIVTILKFNLLLYAKIGNTLKRDVFTYVKPVLSSSQRIAFNLYQQWI